MSEITDGSIIQAVKEQASCRMAGESVILNLKRGLYYGLNPVGSWIWNKIQEPQSFKDLLDAMQREYDVDADVCGRDLIALLKALQENELIDVKEDR
jgi:hypothetical protein